MKYKTLGLRIVVASVTVVCLMAGLLMYSPTPARAAAVNTATKTDVTPGTQYTTFKGVPVFRLHVTNSGDAPDTITSLSPTPSGNVNDTTITLHFYHDVNNNGFVDQGDTNLGASAAFTSDDTIQTFNITDVTVPASGSASVLITADGAGVGNAQTFTLSFALSTDISMGAVAVDTGGFPLANANPLTTSNTAPSLSITDGANDPAAKFATASQTGVTVKQLSITAAATSDSIVSLAITPAGTENDFTNISSTKFYIDSGTTPGVIDGSDILLAKTPATYTADNTITTFTFTSPIQIATASTVNILYTYDLGAGVVGGNTLTARLVATTDAVAGSGIVVSSNSSLISATITIATSAPTLAQPTVVPASTVKASSAAKVIGAFSVTETGGLSDTIDQFRIENKTALTAVAADIASVAIYSDGGTLGIIDGGDAVACAESTTVTTTEFNAGGSLINFTCSSPIVIGASATQNYLAVITTTVGATDGRTMAARVNAHLVTANAWAASDLETTNSITIDTVAPTVTVTMDDAALNIGDTALVTFTFTEAPTGFTAADVDLTNANGTIGTIDATNPLIQTATFTPTNGITDATNIITIGTAWTDAAGNAGVGDDSPNFTIDTVAPSGGGGGYYVAQQPTATPIPTFTPIPFPLFFQRGDPANLGRYNLREGDVVRAPSADDPDVYIVNEHGYKRLFLNPAIFRFYAHLGWSRVRSIVPVGRDAFPTSGLFRNCEANDPKVYAVEVTGEDSGTLHHVQMSGDAAVAQDPDFFKKVFCINNNEFNWYTKSPTPYTSLSQTPVYSRLGQ